MSPSTISSYQRRYLNLFSREKTQYFADGLLKIFDVRFSDDVFMFFFAQCNNFLSNDDNLENSLKLHPNFKFQPSVAYKCVAYKPKSVYTRKTISLPTRENIFPRNIILLAQPRKFLPAKCIFFNRNHPRNPRKFMPAKFMPIYSVINFRGKNFHGNKLSRMRKFYISREETFRLFYSNKFPL